MGDMKDSGYIVDGLNIKRRPLVASVKESLIEFIRKNKLEGDTLPSEENLCKMIGVSRATLRNALAILEIDGFIMKKQGIGTCVKKNALNPRIRLNEAPEFSALIRSFGYRSEIKYISYEIRSDLDEISECLYRGIGEKIHVITKTFLADGQPAIYCIDYIPFSLFPGNFEESDLNITVYELLKNKCNLKVNYNITTITPIVARGNIAREIGVEDETPIIMFLETGFDMSDNAVLCSKEYYRTDLIEMSIYRKKV